MTDQQHAPDAPEHPEDDGRQQRHPTWKDDAFGQERAVITRRRGGGGDVSESLVGLAISGGGIRSATFALGVLEALRRTNRLARIDYLSTVSGGGYIGAWLTGNCHRRPRWLAAPAENEKDEWRESIAYLRRYSNYLSPTVGFFSADTWSMATIWLRNTLLIQATVILAIAAALLLPRLLFELFEHWPQAGQLRWITIALFILGAVGIAANQWRLTTDRPLPLLQAQAWRKGLALAAGLALTAWLWGRLRAFEPFGTGEVSYLSALPIAALLVAAGFCLLPVGVRFVAFLEGRANAPTQINYDQGWVQRVVIVPLMTVGYLVAAILWGETTGLASGGHLTGLESYGIAFTTAWRYWPFPLAVVFVSIWWLSFFAIRRTGWVAGALSLLPPLIAVPVLHALLCAVMLLLHAWAQMEDGAGAWRAFIWGPPMVSLTFVLTIVVLIGMMGRQSTDGVREWWSRLGAWLGIYATAWMVMAVAAVYGPQLVDWAFHTHFWKSMTVGAGWVATVAGGLFSGNSASTGGDGRQSMTTQLKEILAAVAPFLFIAGLLIAIAYALESIVGLNSTANWNTVAASLLQAAKAGGGATGFHHADHAGFLNMSAAMLAGCLAALALMAWRVDINEFSLNAFYRNRLVRCYLGATRTPGERAPQNFTGFDPKDDILLKDLVNAVTPPAGPLHIVNCALNLGGSSDLALHTRHSAIFTLSPVSCGTTYRSRDQSGVGTTLGYVDTSAYGGHSGAPTLGQAISVSGAAASPNMGYHTSPVVAFLLTVFNVRLGWWFPNPGRTATEVASPHFNLRYLFAELFGGADDKSPFLMISDGGHFENLAAYELVRRRCRLVIISDAECDPTLSFEGLGRLIRMCEVDFNCRIKIVVDDIRPTGRPRWSRKRFAVGQILYADGRRGVLVYLKASMTSHEDTAVLQYKSSHPAFPHESTGDQFYAEDQFESYRSLGQAVAMDAFGTDTNPDIIAWAEQLLIDCDPGTRGGDLGDRAGVGGHGAPLSNPPHGRR
jgi:Patatin-like phospholipase